MTFPKVFIAQRLRIFFSKELITWSHSPFPIIFYPELLKNITYACSAYYKMDTNVADKSLPVIKPIIHLYPIINGKNNTK